MEGSEAKLDVSVQLRFLAGLSLQASSLLTWLIQAVCSLIQHLILLLGNIDLYLEMKLAALGSLQNSQRGLEEEQSSSDSTLAHLSRLRG